MSGAPGAGERADVFLVAHGYAQSRAEAQAAIHAGRVSVNGKVLVKPSQTVGDGAAIQFEKAHPYVSRGALKLVAALDRFALSPEGLICVDIGASTGGFTEVLLARGATRVYAVDVGHSQIHAKLRRDPRVTLRDGVNARDLDATHVPEPFAAITVDVSFIGLRLALPAALALAAPGAWLVALVKPQFEVGRFAVGKGGIVRDAEAQEAALSDLAKWIASESGWSVLGVMESPIQGGDGNREFLVAARKA
jgi:23S rRNA (cytidine1920-2'-O)/16S rRNA (cytidine1409-2'-O)-methyltransferase